MILAIAHFAAPQFETCKGLRSIFLWATLRAKFTSKEKDKRIKRLPRVMISKCANPNCSKLLMRMDGGRFFGFHTKSKNIENFWLCSSCSKSFTLRLIEGQIELVHRNRKTA